MAYEVTATRKRPTNLDGLIGQEFVVATLKNSIQDGRIAHAYLFSGPRGVGKTSAARILARALNCSDVPNPDGDVQAEADSITRGTALDVIEIDGASNTSVNDVREIKDEVLFPPNHSRYKIYIIDEVHMLSTSAFNALLKTIEEPPPYIIFIFATTELHKVPATIKSRCQQFHFRLIPLEQILEKLVEASAEMKLQADPDALMWIAKEGRGSLRDAYTLFDQVVAFSDGHITLEKIKAKLGLVGLDRLNAIAEALSDGSLQQVLEAADDIMTNGVSVDQFIIDLNEYFRNLLLLRAGIKRESVIGYPIREFSSQALEAWSKHQLMHALDLLLEAFRRLRYTVNERFELELVLSELTRLKDYIDPGQLLNRIHDLRKLTENGSFRLPDAPQTGTVPPAEKPQKGTVPKAAGSFSEPDKGEKREKVSEAATSVPEPADEKHDQTPDYVQYEAEEGSYSADDMESARSVDTGEKDPGDDNGHSETVQGTVPAAGMEDTAGAPESERRALDLSEFERLIEEVNHRSMSLGSALSGAIGHIFDDRFLYLQFRSAYASRTIDLESDLIEECIHTVLGVPLRVRVETLEAAEEDASTSHPDPQVELPRKVFRGKVISG
ncbi:MAG: DNA polymerase III subunit gamma/tau [Spirochaeta sp.]